MPNLYVADATVCGRITNELELKQAGNSQVCNFTVAVTRLVKKENGNEEKTDFMRCEAWGARAKFITDYFGKGSPIYIKGNLETREWTDKETQKKRNETIIRVNDAKFVETKSEKERRTGESGNDSAKKTDANGFLELNGEEDIDALFT